MGKRLAGGSGGGSVDERFEAVSCDKSGVEGSRSVSGPTHHISAGITDIRHFMKTASVFWAIRMKVSTNWLRDFVTLAPPITRIADRLTLAGLSEKVDQIDDLEDRSSDRITSNRRTGFPCRGCPRDFGGRALSLKMPLLVSRRANSSGRLEDSYQDAEACPYYRCSIRGSPKRGRRNSWFNAFLPAVSAVSTIVDITNYVLLEYGQPLHAFDRPHSGKNRSARRSRGNSLRQRRHN